MVPKDLNSLKTHLPPASKGLTHGCLWAAFTLGSLEKLYIKMGKPAENICQGTSAFCFL